MTPTQLTHLLTDCIKSAFDDLGRPSQSDRMKALGFIRNGDAQIIAEAMGICRRDIDMTDLLVVWLREHKVTVKDHITNIKWEGTRSENNY